MNKFYSTMDVCKLTGIAEHQIRYAFRVGYLEKPATEIAGRLVFGRNDLRRICEHFRIDIREVDEEEDRCTSNTNS